MSETERYGNDRIYADLPVVDWAYRPVEIWKDIGMGHHQVIATACDRFEAQNIIDALIAKAEGK